MRPSLVATASVLIGAFGCAREGSTPPQPPPAPGPAVVSAVSVTSQDGIVETAVAAPPSVRVTTASGTAASGITVTFAVTNGGGSVTGATPATNVQGIATLGSWTLGPVVGENTLTASVPGTASVSFRAMAMAQRSLADRPDGVSGSQLHVLYVVPSDAQDRQLDVNGTLMNSVASFQTWLAGETGGRQLRVDTYQGALDISFVRLTRTDALMKSYGVYIRDTIEKDLTQAGLINTQKLYAAYYDGGSNHSCGGGAWPPALPGRVGAMYLRGTPPNAPPCGTNQLATSPSSPPRYFEFGMLHELLHTLGFVAGNAPRHHLNGHVPEPNDLMYAGSAPWQLPNLVLDVGHDDYYGGNVPAGVLNFANSPFLLPAAVTGSPARMTSSACVRDSSTRTLSCFP